MPPTETVDRIEDFVLSRRGVLLATAAAGTGFFAGRSTFSGTSTERAATLAGAAVAATETTYHLPAVSGNGNGIIVDIAVTTEPGDGRLFVDLDAVEVRHDVQLALNEATRTAARMAGVALTNRDVFVTFDPPEDRKFALSGKSWEAGITVTLLGAFTDRVPSTSTLVTGVVDAKNALIPVGGVEAKAVAARDFGADTLLVPPNHVVDVSGISVEAVPDLDTVVQRVLE